MVVSVTIFISSHYSFAKCPTRMGSLYPQDNFWVIAHRGSVTKFPENTFPAFQEALDIDGANSLAIDLSFTNDKKVVLWHDWDPNSPIALIRQGGREPVVKFLPSTPPPSHSRWRQKTSELTLSQLRAQYGYEEKITHYKSRARIPTFQEFIEWAQHQDKLQLVLLKFRVPREEIPLLSVMLKKIKAIMDSLDSPQRFQLVFSIPYKDALKKIKNQFSDFMFSYDQEIPAAGVVNYHRFTTIPRAMELRNGFAEIGFSALPILASPPLMDPWVIYQHVLSLDFKIRDNYRNSTSAYIKMISWNFNNEEKMRCLINLGIDGIVTDRPDVLRTLALDMGKKLD